MDLKISKRPRILHEGQLPRKEGLWASLIMSCGRVDDVRRGEQLEIDGRVKGETVPGETITIAHEACDKSKRRCEVSRLTNWLMVGGGDREMREGGDSESDPGDWDGPSGF